MAINTYKLSLNQSRFPMTSKGQSAPTMIAQIDTAGRQPRQYQGSDENIDFNIPQILAGQNFAPVSGGIASVSYRIKIDPNPKVPALFPIDQIIPLRDSNEDVVLFSPSRGLNYIYRDDLNVWQGTSVTDILLALPDYPRVLVDGIDVTTSTVTRAYVDGKTFVAYSRLAAVEDIDFGPGPTMATGPVVIPPEAEDASIYYWDNATSPPSLAWVAWDQIVDPSSPLINPPFSAGTIDGISSSNGYLLIWSGLEIAWAPFDQSLGAFNFAATQDGELTGAGVTIPEDLQGPITAVIPVAGGAIIFTNKNAVAMFYNSSNFAAPFIFKGISNAGGVESYEQVASEGPAQTIYAYTTGGLQKISLNSATPEFPDVTDFLGGHAVEHFDIDQKTFDYGEIALEFFTKLTYCGQRYLVISYGFYPNVFSYALIFDTALGRWGKLRIPHKDCFYYSYGSEAVDLTYAMLFDVTYDELVNMSYDQATISGRGVTYPRQSIAFASADGVIKIAVMDDRLKTDDSISFVVIGKNQLSRNHFPVLHKLELDGLRVGGVVGVIPSLNGRTHDDYISGYLYDATDDYGEYNFDLVTAKRFSVYIEGQFNLQNIIVSAGQGDAE